MGAACVDIDESKLKPNAAVPKSMTKELAKANEFIDLPALTWTGNIDGHPLKILLIFQIHPFVVDAHARSAHFPITVGLHLMPSDTLESDRVVQFLQEPWSNPKNWSKNDRESFWEQLLKGVRDVAKTIAPAPPREIAEAIISVNAKVKVAVGDSSRRRRQQLKEC